ncbi:MAG: hypothetical protein HY906_20865 [Deltaproteobacteria bacterium]|nr:hypothetical protein [Deltaproteobacteria bacterium]
MTRVGLALALAASVLGAGAPAAAAPLAPGTARAFDDLPAFTLQLRPRALHARAPLLRSRLLRWPAAAAALAQAQGALGVDLLDERSFQRTGLDADAPVAVSGFAIDRGEVDAAYLAARAALLRRDWRGLHGLPPVFYHHRITARVADPGRLGRFLAEQAGRPLTVLGLPALQQVFGLDRKAAAETLTLLRAAGAVAVARLPGDGLVLVRVRASEEVVVDLLQPWLGARPSPTELARLLARVSAAPPRRVRGDARLLLPADVTAALHLSGAGLASLAEVNLRERALVSVPQAAPARRAPALAAVDATIGACHDGLQKTLAAATFDDATVALRVSPHALDLRLSWALTRGRPGAFTTRDDRVVSLDPVAHAALGVLQLRLDLAAFPRQIPRAGPFAGHFAELSRFLSSCGPLASFLAAVRLWPELLALALDEAQAERDAGDVVRGLHNVTLAVTALHAGEPRLLGFGSCDPAAARALERLARAGRTPVHLGRTPLPGGRILVLAATDERGLALGRKLAARRGAAKTAVAEVRVDLPALLRAHAGSGVEAALARLLASRLGPARGEVRATTDAVTAEVRVEIH